MRKPTSRAQLAAFLFVDSRWHEPHDAVQCRALVRLSNFYSSFKPNFSRLFLFEFQVVRAPNRSIIEGPLYYNSLLLNTQLLHWRRPHSVTLNMHQNTTTHAIGINPVPIHVTKAYRGSRGIAPLNLNLGTR